MTENITLTDEQLSKLLEDAAERGAEKALDKLGLSDEQKREALQEAIDFGDTWSKAKKTAFDTFVRVFTTAVLGALAVGLGVKFLSSSGVK